MRSPPAPLTPPQQLLLDGIQVRLLEPDALLGCAELLDQHHYLGSLQPVGERLHYALTAALGDWLGVLVFCAAARRLHSRDQWLGWSEEQRRRLPLVVNHTRLLLLPHNTFPSFSRLAHMTRLLPTSCVRVPMTSLQPALWLRRPERTCSRV